MFQRCRRMLFKWLVDNVSDRNQVTLLLICIIAPVFVSVLVPVPILPLCLSLRGCVYHSRTNALSVSPSVSVSLSLSFSLSFGFFLYWLHPFNITIYPIFTHFSFSLSHFHSGDGRYSTNGRRRSA